MAMKTMSKLKKNADLELLFTKATLKLHNCLRIYVARFRFRKLLASSHDHVVLVQLKSASNLIGTNSLNETSDVYCRVVGSRFIAINTRNKAGRVVASKQGVTKSISSYTSKTITNTINPIWNEESFVTGIYGSDSVIVNIYDKDTFTKDTFLGQVEIPLSDHPQLFRSTMGSREIHLDDLPLKKNNTNIHDMHGDILTINDCIIPEARKKIEHKRGFISITLRLPALINNMCGFMYKLSSSVIPGMPKSFKRRYMVLKEGLLVYFDDSFSLQDPRYEVWCQDVINIEETFNHSKTEIETFSVTFGPDSWTVKFDENMNTMVRKEWLRKIRFNCYNVNNKSIRGASRLSNFPLLLNVRNKIGTPVNNTNTSGTSGGTIGSPSGRERMHSNASEDVNSPIAIGSSGSTGSRVTRRRSSLGGVIEGALSTVGGVVVGAVGKTVGVKK